MEHDEYMAIQEFLDSEADNDISLDELLESYDLTFETALEFTNNYRKNFFEMLDKQEIKQTSPTEIFAEISRKTAVNHGIDMLKLYCIAVTDNGLLFEDSDDDEQRIRQWIEQSAKAEDLAQHLMVQPEYRERLRQLPNAKIKSDCKNDFEEQAELFKMAIQHKFLYKGKNSNVFLNNIGELVRQVNAVPEYAEIKPFIYTSVLTRKHKLMLERADYSPNIADIFKYKEYRINEDNGKNFDTYQSYLEMYDQFFRHFYGETDRNFCDYCYAETTNLNDWYYANCQPDEHIPMSFRMTVNSCFGTFCKYGAITETEYNPVLEIAFENVYNMHPDCDAAELCRLANAEKYADSETALKFAEQFLADKQTEKLREMLLDAAENFK